MLKSEVAKLSSAELHLTFTTGHQQTKAV